MGDPEEVTEELRDALRMLVAIERDRQLDFPEDELHVDPTYALEIALKALEKAGDEPDEIVLPDDQERLGIGLNAED